MNPKCPKCKKTMKTKTLIVQSREGMSGLAKFWVCPKRSALDIKKRRYPHKFRVGAQVIR